MIDTKEDLGFEEGNTGNAASTHMVHDVPKDTGITSKILKSPWTPRPKKYNKTIRPVHMSPRNLQFSNLSMEEKGKVVTIETDEEQEELRYLIVEVEEEEDMEADIQPMHSAAKLPEYVPP